MQGAGGYSGGKPTGDDRTPACSADERALTERALARPVEPMARVVVTEARGQARLVDAFALYTPDADKSNA